MKAWAGRLLLLAVVAGLLVWGWRVFFPGPERVIGKRLTEIRELVSFGSNEGPLAKLGNTEKLLGKFAPDTEVVVDWANRQQTLQGTEELRQTIMAARSALTSLRVEFIDVVVKVGADKRLATADLTARAEISGERDPYIQEMLFSFKKVEGDWLVTRVEPVKTLH